MTVSVLREMFRNYRQWQSLWESESLDTICAPDGEEFNFLDLQVLYENLHRLPRRQHEAIELYLIQNMREKDAAVSMGLSPTNPIGIYASVGLMKLIDMTDRGLLSRSKANLDG